MIISDNTCHLYNNMEGSLLFLIEFIIFKKFSSVFIFFPLSLYKFTIGYDLRMMKLKVDGY